MTSPVSTMSYLELLKLASPETVVVISALVVLASCCPRACHRNSRGAHVAPKCDPFRRDACDHTAHVAFQNHLPRAGLFHSVYGAIRRIPASSGRIPGDRTLGGRWSHAARWQ